MSANKLPRHLQNVSKVVKLLHMLIEREREREREREKELKLKLAYVTGLTTEVEV